ncbi:hypothetical protein ABIA32_001558 [Streptacidiphilus sp. MAP12-20]
MDSSPGHSQPYPSLASSFAFSRRTRSAALR